MVDGLLKETERLMEQRPLAREILTVFRDLAALMTEASPLEKETHLDDRLKDIKREEGFPLFSREDLPVDLESAAELLGRFLTTLRTKERPDREGLQRTLEAFNKDNAWSRRLFSVILKNDEGTLSTIAAEVHLDPQTLKFLAQIALTPSLRALRRLYADQVDPDTWGQGSCLGSGTFIAGFVGRSGPTQDSTVLSAGMMTMAPLGIFTATKKRVSAWISAENASGISRPLTVVYSRWKHPWNSKTWPPCTSISSPTRKDSSRVPVLPDGTLELSTFSSGKGFKR